MMEHLTLVMHPPSGVGAYLAGIAKGEFMKELTAKERLIINEWKKRQVQYDQAKLVLKETLGRYGAASSEFNAARVDFEMLKEEFDNFEKENHAVLSDYR
jgi:hypothetical protein